MWSTARSTAARQLRVARAGKVNTGLSASSRVAHGPASFVIPTSYRPVLSSRSFTDTSAELAAKPAAAAKKPRATKSTTTASATKAKKKPAAKKGRTVKKAKKPAVKKKAAPKKPAKKELKPEVKRRLEVQKLREIALLDEPKKGPRNVWVMYVMKHSTKGTAKGEHMEKIKGLASEFQNLSESEKERLAAEVIQSRLAAQAAYKAWVESHTPLEIDAANRARSRLRVLAQSGTNIKKLPPIKDDRLPKKGLNSYSLFTQSRWNSGDFAGKRVSDAAVEITAEWKALSDAEKKGFQDIAEVEADRYAKHVQEVLHRDVYNRKSPSP